MKTDRERLEFIATLIQDNPHNINTLLILTYVYAKKDNLEKSFMEYFNRALDDICTNYHKRVH